MNIVKGLMDNGGQERRVGDGSEIKVRQMAGDG
jgi:hypothetical protein